MSQTNFYNLYWNYQPFFFSFVDAVEIYWMDTRNTWFHYLRFSVSLSLLTYFVKNKELFIFIYCLSFLPGHSPSYSCIVMHLSPFNFKEESRKQSKSFYNSTSWGIIWVYLPHPPTPTHLILGSEEMRAPQSYSLPPPSTYLEIEWVILPRYMYRPSDLSQNAM